MKPLLRLTIAAGLVLAMAASSYAASYNVTLAPGWNTIANQITTDGGNNVRTIFLRPAPPLGSKLQHFDLTTGTFGSLETYEQLPSGGTTWIPGTNILNTGDGVVFFNPTSSNVTLTINGIAHVPKLPINIGSGPALVGRQTNDVATLTDILGFKPPNFTAVYRFIPGPGHDPTVFASSNFTVYAFNAGAWATPPGVPPTFNVGESIWVTTNGTLPSVLRGPSSQTVCPGNRVGFAAAATGTPPLSFQWLFNGKPISGATANTYVIPIATATNSGSYSVQVTNPFGSTTSKPATLVSGDTQPPVIVCPSNIVTACQGPGGTFVQFGVGIADNCDDAPTLTINPPSGSQFPGGVTTVTVTATDASGNTTNCTFTVTVVDKTPPQISCPPNRVVMARDPKGALVYYSVAATDDCDTNVKVDCQPPSGSVFPLGSTVVLCKATDSSGNTSACRFVVTVVDPSCCRAKLWTQPDVSSPGGRFGHVMAYDSNRGRVVLFGGENPNGILGDTWEWDGSAWTHVGLGAVVTHIIPTGPPGRTHAAMAFDSRIGQVVLHGGRGVTGGLLDDTWLWDGSNWTEVTSKSVGARFNHAMAYDEARQVTVLYGGSDANGGELGDTWEFDGAKWNLAAATSTSIGPRQGHAMAFGSAQRQLLLFGGQTKGVASSDTWQWDGKVWKQLAKTGPSPRAFHSMAYSDNCDAVVLFGGGTNGVLTLNDTWEWDGKAWAQTAAKLPPGRGQAAMAHDSAHGQTVLFGGTQFGKEWLGDTRLYGSDQTPPQVVSVDAICGDQVIIVAFDGPVSAFSAEDTNHYVVVCNAGVNATARTMLANNGSPVDDPLITGGANRIIQATLTDDPRIVRLTTADPINGFCTLFLGGIQDACGQTLAGAQIPLRCRIDPCVRGSAGTEFWLTFPGNYALDSTNHPQPQVFIAGPSGTIGTVSMPGMSPAFSSAFSIPATGIAAITLPSNADLGDAIDVVNSNAVHVVASTSISVYGLNHMPFTSDAYLGLSTRAIGNNYLVMAYGNLFKGVPDLNGTQFAIAATADNTHVMISPAVTVGSRAAGVPYTITLMQGQTYQLRCTNDAPADLSGTVLVSDQPISVFGGHRCANVPNNQVFFADHLVEQLPPTDLWGFNFVTVPLATRLAGDTFRVMALVDGTTVTTNGVAISTTLNRGKFVEFQLTKASQITANSPILVAQYADSSDFDLVLNSDPFMILVPPVAFFGPSYLVTAPSTDFTGNFLNLMVPSGSEGQVLLDGTFVSPTLFSAIGSSGYSGAQVPVSVGTHSVATTNNVAFGLIAYGWSLYDGYGYPGQSCGTAQGRPTQFTCPSVEQFVQAGTNCLAAVPDLTKKVGNGGAALLITQDPAPGTVVAPGAYPITITITDPLGGTQTCRSILTVGPSPTAGLQCPSDIVTNCANASGQIVTYSVGMCNTNFTLTSVPPSGSLFPSGVTTVVCTAKNTAGVTESCSFTVTVNCPSAVRLSSNGSNLSIDWTGSGTLQQATKITGPWVPVQGALPPYLLKPTNSAAFFRITQ